MKTDTQITLLFAAFYYFSVVVEKNDGKIPDKLNKIFMPLARLTRAYDRKLKQSVQKLNTVLGSIEFKRDVDYILVAVNIIAEYYEQTKGTKRLFYPMSYDNIRTLQFECEELTEPDTVEASYIFAELLVQELKKKE